jgi:transketolase
MPSRTFSALRPASQIGTDAVRFDDGGVTSMRAVEQVRTDICYQNLNVKIIATHGGVSFGAAGSTHHCTEDIAIMRAIANMTVIIPADGIETACAVRAAIDYPGPVYIRIGRGFEPTYYEDENYGFQIGKAVTVAEGTDITLICCGITVLNAAEAAKILKEQDGLSVRVLDMHTIKTARRGGGHEGGARDEAHHHLRGPQRVLAGLGLRSPT